MIPEDRQNQLWRLLNELRSSGFSVSGDLAKTLAWLREQGERLSIPEIIWLQSKFGHAAGEYLVPPALARFLAELLRSREAMSLLDPAARLGLLGASIAAQVPLERTDLICQLHAAAEVLSSVESSRVNVIIGDREAVEAQLATSYDAIVSIPPITGRRERRSYATSSGEVSVAGDDSELMLIDISKRMSDDGLFACVMSPRFTWDENKDSVRQNLPKFGLYLTALLRLRPGTCAATNLAFDLAIVERVDRENLFVAEVPDDERGQDELIARLRDRKEGHSPTQGRLVSRDEFRGLEVLEALDRSEKLGLRKGMAAIPFTQAVHRVAWPKRRGKEFTRCEEHANAVYLPEMASTPATTSQAELPEKLKSYLQLHVNPEVALPEYFAHWLNTPLGHALRQSTMRGTTIPRISKPALAESVVYLPTLAEQRAALQALATIRGLRSELSELEARVWDRPRKVDEVLAALQNVNHEERFSDWLEALPFPLASILRTYHAVDRTEKDRYERLLHFFEALAAFTATIHLSAFRSNDAAWNEVRPKLVGALAKQNLSFERPTFGLWRVCLETLAVEARKLVHGKAEEQLRAGVLFHVAELSPVEVLSSKKLLSVLQRTNNHRNRWTGHGGAVNAAEAAERLNILQNELEELREVFGTVFLRYELIEPREAEIMAGPIYRCNTRRVMGSNPAFEHRLIELISPAYTGGLYLHNVGHDQALELLQFVQLKHAPQPACYFFNREESTGTFLVSYHFAEKPEVVDPTHPFQQLLTELTEQKNAD